MSPRPVLLAGSLGMAGSALMQTLLANATPRIAAEFADPAAYAWVGTAYLVASAVTLPVFSQLADRIGCRRVFVLGHVCFALGAVGVAIAPTLPLLLAARVAQGVGAGAVAPTALAMIGLAYEADARNRAMGRIAVVQVVANVVGPLLGGWFIEGPGWRFGALAPVPLSVGALALTGSIATRPAAAGWWRLSPGEQTTMLRTGGLRRPVILAGVAGAVSLGTLTYAPVALQDVQGISATATGWLLVAMLVAMGVGARAASKLAARRWVRPAGWGLALAGAPLVAVPLPSVTAVGLAFVGLGVGGVTPLVLLDAQRAARPEHLAQAGGLAQLGRTVGAAMAIPALGLAIVLGVPLPIAIPMAFVAVAALCGTGVLISLGTEPEEP